MTVTAGSLCSGVGGLELGLERALGARTVWQSELDPHATTVLAHHWPDTPNLGDLTAVDWTQVEPVDVMCFGFPCQDISQAGRKAGIEGDRSALWFDCAHAVRLVQPRYVLVENVSALFVRGFDVVLADLAEMGYMGRWGCLRSSQIGAPHRRERVFVAAHAGGAGTDGAAPTDTAATRRGQVGTRERSDSSRTSGQPGPLRQPGRRRSATADAHHEGRPANQRQEPRSGQRADTGASRDPAADADSERLTLWPELDSDPETRLETPRRDHADRRDLWGPYAPAIHRWEAIHGPAPASRDERGRLNPELPEWMMGFPPGWVTDPELGLPRTAQLRLLGNSVQPQVAELAAQLLLAPLLALEAAA